MRIVHVTAGTGGWYCGTCIRDNALTRALVELGHEATLVPLYLPILGEGAACSADRPVLMGGISVYLRHASSLYRAMPGWVDRALAARPLLQLAGRNAGSTRPEHLGPLTISMLRGADGPIAEEVHRLVAHLQALAPDVVVLSNSMLAGVVPAIRAALGVPVVVTIQGEGHFIDQMGGDAAEIWVMTAGLLRQAQARVAVSAFAAQRMAARTGLDVADFEVVHNGVDLTGYGPEPDPQDGGPPVLGFLARLIPDKGLHEVVRLYRSLLATHPDLRLRLVGTLNGGDLPALDAVVSELAEVGPTEVFPNASPEDKRRLLRGMTVLCVPAVKEETFGQYLVEGMATGLPVVAVGQGAVPEVLGDAGQLVPPGSPEHLRVAVDELLRDPARRARMGARGRHRATTRFTSRHMAERELEVLQRLVEGR